MPVCEFAVVVNSSASSESPSAKPMNTSWWCCGLDPGFDRLRGVGPEAVDLSITLPERWLVPPPVLPVVLLEAGKRLPRLSVVMKRLNRRSKTGRRTGDEAMIRETPCSAVAQIMACGAVKEKSSALTSKMELRRRAPKTMVLAKVNQSRLGGIHTEKGESNPSENEWGLQHTGYQHRK